MQLKKNDQKKLLQLIKDISKEYQNEYESVLHEFDNAISTFEKGLTPKQKMFKAK